MYWIRLTRFFSELFFDCGTLCMYLFVLRCQRIQCTLAVYLELKLRAMSSLNLLLFGWFLSKLVPRLGHFVSFDLRLKTFYQIIRYLTVVILDISGVLIP